MSTTRLNVKLDRADGGTPWGFRMTGGKDFGSPLVIQRVTAGSLAAKCGLQEGDTIVEIGSSSTEQLRHKEAQDLIVAAGNSLQLALEKPSQPGVSSSVKAAPPVLGAKPTVAVKPVIPAKPSEAGAETKPTEESVVKLELRPAETNAGADEVTIDFKIERKTIVIPSAGGHSKPADIAPHVSERDEIVSASVERKTIVIPSARQQQQPVSDASQTDDGQTKKYVPSETYRLVHEQDTGVSGTHINPMTGAEVKPTQSRTLMMLDRALENNETLQAPLQRKTVVIPSSKSQSSGLGSRPAPASQRNTQWPPQAPSGTRKMNVAKAGEAKNVSAAIDSSVKIPVCCDCGIAIRGAYVSAVNKTWCPDHFVCANPQCRQPLANTSFIEEEGQLFCEKDYEQFFAPHCGKCGKAIIGTVVSAIEQKFHVDCFTCFHCHRPIANGLFRLEQGQPYCDEDWSSMFQTKCYGCQFPVEPGDRWIEALGQNWHAECFNCSICQANLEGQSFLAKSGKPYCKKHSTSGLF